MLLPVEIFKMDGDQIYVKVTFQTRYQLKLAVVLV